MTAAFIEGDLDAVAELYAPDAVAVTPDMGEIFGREQIMAYLRQFGTAFPDARYELTTGYEAGNVAIDEGFFVGTNTGPLEMPTGQLPATGRELKMRACDIAVVEDGLIISHRFYYDQLELMEQLGLMPEPAGG